MKHAALVMVLLTFSWFAATSVGAQGSSRRDGDRRARSGSADQYENPQLAKDDGERRILQTLAAMRQGPRHFFSCM